MVDEDPWLINVNIPEFKLREHPLQCPGGYSLDMYCKYENPDHRWDEFPRGYTEYGTEAQSIAAARRDGWIYHRDRTATCPKCAKQLKKKTD